MLWVLGSNLARLDIDPRHSCRGANFYPVRIAFDIACSMRNEWQQGAQNHEAHGEPCDAFALGLSQKHRGILGDIPTHRCIQLSTECPPVSSPARRSQLTYQPKIRQATATVKAAKQAQAEKIQRQIT